MRKSIELKKPIQCPYCKSETPIKVYPDTILINFPLYCPKCKMETKISIVQYELLFSEASS